MDIGKLVVDRASAGLFANPLPDRCAVVVGESGSSVSRETLVKPVIEIGSAFTNMDESVFRG